jgi:hypothetical protein
MPINYNLWTSVIKGGLSTAMKMLNAHWQANQKTNGNSNEPSNSGDQGSYGAIIPIDTGGKPLR